MTNDASKRRPSGNLLVGDAVSTSRRPRLRDWHRAIVRATAGGAVFALVVVATLFPVLGATIMSVRDTQHYLASLPSKLPTIPPPQRSRILAADGSLIARFYSENRLPVKIEKVAPVMQKAIVAIEDSRFYQHQGVDPRGTLRAAVTNLAGQSVQGGSTITQQYVKNVLANAATSQAERDRVTSRTSYLRKLREARYAAALEKRESKKKILQGYLNISYFGDGAYGIGSAARHFFSRPPSRLTLPQAAMLAGMVQSPSRYDPTSNPREALDRRNTVLYRMRQLGRISQGAYDRARRSPLELRVSDPRNGCSSSKYAFYCQWVKQQLQDDPVFGATAAIRQTRLYRGGMTIHTAMDPKAQKIAQHAVDSQLGRRNRVAAAPVVVQPGTGKVVAMATNRTFGNGPGETEVLLPVVPAFQPGSNFKPFTLATALERGYDLSTVWNAPSAYYPSTMNYPPGGFKNSGSYESGPLTAPQALWRSSNTWFVHLEEQVGVLNVADMAKRLGITSLPRTGPNAITPRDGSLTLGTYEVSPLQMAGAYATFAAHGVHCDPIGITKITDATGRDIEVPPANCHQAITAGVADTMASIMQGTIDGPDPARTGATLSLGRPAAGKTGTTENQAAVWFSGYTPQFATSVWVGDPRGGFAHPLYGFYANGQYIDRAYGYLVAGPIWKEVMLGISKGLPKKKFAPPDPTTAAGESRVTPDVRGLTVGQAIEVLHANGFSIQISRERAQGNALARRDRVARTLPRQGAPIGFRQSVTLVLTKGSTATQKMVPPAYRP